MIRRLSPTVQWALMSLVSAFLFVQFFALNEFLFGFLEHAKGINWVFLPAGFRVLLVLLLGIPGAVGIALGSLWLNADQLPVLGPMPMLLTSIVSGFSPWCVKYAMEMRGILHRELSDISSARLLQFVLLYAMVNAIVHQLIFWQFSLTGSQPWVGVWPMFVGDMVGALVILYVFKMGLRWLRDRVQARS